MNRPAKVTQAEIARAVRVAKGAGMYVEIAPDGTIRIIPFVPNDPKPLRKGTFREHEEIIL